MIKQNYVGALTRKARVLNYKKQWKIRVESCSFVNVALILGFLSNIWTIHTISFSFLAVDEKRFVTGLIFIATIDIFQVFKKRISLIAKLILK